MQMYVNNNVFLSSDVEKMYVLCYGQSLLYTWDEPMKSHELVCSFIEPKSTTETIALEKVNDIFQNYFSFFCNFLLRVVLLALRYSDF